VDEGAALVVLVAAGRRVEEFAQCHLHARALLACNFYKAIAGADLDVCSSAEAVLAALALPCLCPAVAERGGPRRAAAARHGERLGGRRCGGLNRVTLQLFDTKNKCATQLHKLDACHLIAYRGKWRQLLRNGSNLFASMHDGLLGRRSNRDIAVHCSYNQI